MIEIIAISLERSSIFSYMVFVGRDIVSVMSFAVLC